MWKLRTNGLIASSDCRRERFKRRTANHILHGNGSHERSRRTLRRERATVSTSSNEVESVQECSVLDQSEKKCSRQRIRRCGKHVPVQFSLTSLYQPTVLKKWDTPLLKKSRIQNFICRHVWHGKLFSKVSSKFNTNEAGTGTCCRRDDDGTRESKVYHMKKLVYQDAEKSR